MRRFCIFGVGFLPWIAGLASTVFPAPLASDRAIIPGRPPAMHGAVIDHGSSDLSRIPDSWIDEVKSRIKLHFAHTSHGLQLITGLERLSDPSVPVHDPRLVYTHSFKRLPDGPGLSIMGGQTTEYYATPEQYWRSGGEEMTRASLEAFKDINVSMFCWCREMDKYSEADVAAYLKAMSALEQDHPGVIFVYMTGNAQATGPGARNSHLRNEQIRKYCRENGKFLYDFADLDIWYDGRQGSLEYQGTIYPREHPAFRGTERGHASFLSCETKARALWWLLAVIAGWDPSRDVPPAPDPVSSGRR